MQYETLYHNGQFVPAASEDDTFCESSAGGRNDGAIAFTGSWSKRAGAREDASGN